MKEILDLMKQYPGRALFLDESGNFAIDGKGTIIGVLTPFPTPFASEQKLSKAEPPKISEVQIGWYRFTDDTYAPNPVEGKTIKGVVAYFEKGIPQSISIEEEKLAYCNEYFTIEASNKTDGKFNTDLIIKVSRKKGVKAPAAEWAVAQGGFIPANEQWLKMIANLEIINASLERIGAPIINPEQWYLSSTEYDNYAAWIVRLSDGCLDNDGKAGYTFRIRCILN